MKKIFFVTALITIIMAISLTPAYAGTVIKLANAGPDTPDNRTVKAVKVFKYLVEKGTNGEVEVQAFHARKLGDEREALEGMKMGTVQMGTLTSGPMPGFLKTVMFYDIPFLFSSAPAAWEFFESETAHEFNKAFLQKTGVRILATSENGYRHFTNNARPVMAPADMKGLKIRTMENPAHMAMVKALGADPTPIPFGELYMALQQKVVLDAAQVLARIHNGFSQEANIKGLGELKSKGMEIYKPSREEQAQFREQAQEKALEYITQSIGPEWIDKAMKSAKAADDKVGDRADAIIQETIDYANRMLSKVK